MNKCRTGFSIRAQATPVASAIALLVLGCTPHALAQQAPAATESQSGPQLETIVVSANKRVEKLESVPMSISVVNEATLQRNNVREMADIVALMPALTINSGTTSANNAIALRGVGTQTTSIGIEGDVVVIIDDVPISNQFQAFMGLSDIARVEVVKGPQSTLFGKSAIAGGLNIVTKKISGPLQGKTSVLLTSDGEKRVSGSFSGEATETLGIRVAASSSDFAGNINNLTTGQKLGGSAGKSLLTKLSWHPTSQLDVDVSPYYNESRNTNNVNPINQFVIKNTGTSATTQGSIGLSQQAGLAGSNTLGLNGASLPVYLIPGQAPSTGFPATATSINAIPASTAMAGITPTRWNRDIRRDQDAGVYSTDRGLGLRISYVLPNESTLTSITSFDKFMSTDYFDRDFSDQRVIVVSPTTPLTTNSILTLPVSVGNPQVGIYDTTTKTQEIRLVSPDSGTFRYLVGLWLAKSETYRWFNRGDCRAPSVCTSAAASQPAVYQADVYAINQALFGQATWEFSPSWTALAGLRSNIETSGYHFARNFYTNVTPDTFVPGNPGTDVFQSLDNIDRSYTGKLSLSKQFNSDWMGFVSGATGHKGVAFDLLSGLSSATSTPIAAENAVSTEIGVKANLFNNRMTFNATLFNTDFTDYQQASTLTLTDANGAATGTVSKLSSLPRVNTRGLEMEASAMVTRDFNLNASIAFTQATIREWRTASCYSDGSNVKVGTTVFAANGSLAGKNNNCFAAFPGDTAGVQDLAGAPMFSAPKIKLVIGGVYDLRLADLPFNAFINSNIKYQSDAIGSIIQDTNYYIPAYTVTDLGFGITDKRGRYKLSFMVNNLFDRQYTTGGFAQTPTYRGATNAPASVTVSTWKPERDTWRYATMRFDMTF